MNEILLVNPARKKRRKKPATRRKTTTRRRRRRNPVVTAKSIQGQVMTALQGATGALALDVTLGYLPIPENLKGGIVGTGVKALLAIGIGVLGKQTKLVSARTATQLADGALTVVLHDELKRQVQTFAPNLQMGEYLNAGYSNDYNSNAMGYYGSGFNPNQMYLPDISQDTMGFEQAGFGEYLNDDESQGGYQ